jgi:opacity protein-like surface antigen
MAIRPTRRPILFALLVLLGILTKPSFSRAEDTATRDYDRFDIRFGAGWVFGAHTDATLLGSRGVGTAIDFDKTLGGDRTDSLYRVEGTWRWAKRQSLNYSWYDVNRTGLRSIAADIDYGDQTFPAGASIASELNINLHRLMYRYGLARTDQVDFDLGAGLYYAKIKTSLTAQTTIGSVAAGTNKTAEIGAPLPTVGALVKCKLNSRWNVLMSADWFYFKVNNWEGDMSDIQFGVEYSLARNWTLGAAYDRFAMGLSGPTGPGDFSVTNSWNSLFSYVSFHW